ncbi:hypothetical protein CVT24_004833 [Panaeolus cyanescens]|uniref:Uncharacterized protein n=1 Tax=Panaeolus cyanescens TaxID=181874 RepID=A0A409W1Z6_9AGAR|nr:hypothetical protein CVT24_004833 [Panaeolus cyanescens]
MTTTNSNKRASLLDGLRTGGVRSSSLNVPHTAAPTGTFNVPHFPPINSQPGYIEEEEDQFVDIPQHNNNIYNRNIPMTSAVDGPNNRFSQHQALRGMNPNSIPFSPGFNNNNQQVQLQMLQLEVMRMQALQAQQYQMELVAQAHLQQQLQQQQQLQAAQVQARERRISSNFAPPATAGPTVNAFDLRAATLSAQMRRANQADQLRAQLGVSNTSDDQVPRTAALGGRFGSRIASHNLAPNHYNDQLDPPSTPNLTTVISGGTSLGNTPCNNSNSNSAPSKSDAVSSWRRGGNNNSVLSGNRAVSSPSVKITPPPAEDGRSSPPQAVASSPISTSGPRFRPQPLTFNPSVSKPLPSVAIDTTTDDETDADTQSSGSSVKSAASNSSPTTPRSSSSNEMPLSPREEASKRLYEGLGINRPVSANTEQAAQQQTQTHSISVPVVTAPFHRMVSQPTRQPRGPPSGADELGPKNFATRIRRKAIGGLGMLMGARERREFVEAY